MNTDIKPTKKQKIRNWVHRNRFNIAIATVYGGAAIATVYLTIVLSKQMEEEAEAAKEWLRNTIEWINEQQNAGNDVYQLADARFLVIDAAGKQTLHIL